MIRAWISTDVLLSELQKVFQQIAIKKNRDAIRFLFNINGKEKHLLSQRVCFRAEDSPFMLGATLQYHFNKQPPELQDTVCKLKQNT